MNAYLTYIRMNLRLMTRNRAALFFGYLLPLGFFFLFGQMGSARQGGGSQLVSMVLTLGVLGSGFFGTAMYAVMSREQNILRRFKVAPITPAPVLVASLVSSLFNFLPMAAMMLFLANRVYGMEIPRNLPSLFLFVSLGLLAFCTIGNIISAVVNSMQEANIVAQLFYMPMLLLGGATIPLGSMPDWLQVFAQFLPSSHYVTGVQSLIRGRETLLDNLASIGALALTVAVGTFLAMKLFRWEKDEKMRPSAKLWLVAVLAPFLLLGVYQAYSKENIVKSRVLARDIARNRAWLIKDARIFVGDGSVVERGSVLLRNGRIAEIYTGASPDADNIGAAEIEAAGKTLLPGLIDTHVHLGSPGVISEEAFANAEKNFEREMPAYLFSGVTAVKSAGDALDSMLKLRAVLASGQKLGAELFTVGPMFTAEGGHGTEFVRYVPEPYREQVAQQLIRVPKSSEEARKQVAELKALGVDGIKIVLEAGGGTNVFNRLDPKVAAAVAEAARAAGLPVVSHTGAAADVADALKAGVNGLEHGALRDAIPEDLFAKMREQGVTYDPTLAVIEAVQAFLTGNTAPLDRSLVQQVTPREILDKGRAALNSQIAAGIRQSLQDYPPEVFEIAKRNLLAAHRAGVTLVTGTDSGNPFMLHGPGVHRELQLWVAAGIPPAVALQAATYNSARLLRAENRIGLVKQGHEASLLLVDGNPLEDISSTERISTVFFKGERVNRAELFNQK